MARLHRHSGGNPFLLWELLQLPAPTAPVSLRARRHRRVCARSCPAGWTGCRARPARACRSFVPGADVDLLLLNRLVERRPAAVMTAVTEAEAARLPFPLVRVSASSMRWAARFSTHFWVFALPDGQHVEVFGRQHPGKEHLETGPVVGFEVTDLAGAVAELRAAGVELLGEPGPTWQHFRGPDGNVYELVMLTRP